MEDMSEAYGNRAGKTWANFGVEYPEIRSAFGGFVTGSGWFPLQ